MSQRIIVACDGSAGAELALTLVANEAWPGGTRIRLVTALPKSDSAAGRAMGLNAGLVVAFEQEAIATTTATLADLAGRVERPEWSVETAVLRGRAAEAIAADARDWRATLVIVGSRGLGSIATMVLGSTSAELADLAPCPVLVARTTTLRPVLLATDGSDGARDAETVLAGLPGIREASVRVVSVASLGNPWVSSIAPGAGVHAQAAHAQYVEQERASREAAAGAAVGRLREHGIEAAWEVRVGDAAQQIVEAARDSGAALVVVGTRGLTGVARAVLGSVARKVLVHAPASVLVVRAGRDDDVPARD